MTFFDIEMGDPTADFIECWNAAGQHLNSFLKPYCDMNTENEMHCVNYRAHPYPPYLEHLSFRLGNQNFYVRIEDINRQCNFPGNRRGLAAVAEGNSGWACILPMVKSGREGKWKARFPGWGLRELRTRKLIDPPSLITDELIEMTHWEVHGFGVQIVHDCLKDEGYKIMSENHNPLVDPSIWFVGNTKAPEWVVVRTTKYPEKCATRPENLEAIAEHIRKMSKVGHFASISFANNSQCRESTNAEIVPLWRGQKLSCEYDGLEPLQFF